MRIKEKLDKLTDVDTYSLILFTLYQLTDVPEYSSLSELAYILDKQNLLKLCEYFGGSTIKIPTVKELTNIIYALLIFQSVNIEGKTYEEAMSLIDNNKEDTRAIRACYLYLVQNIEKYNINTKKHV